MRFDVVTLFPEMVSGPLGASIIGRAQAAGTVQVVTHDLRPYGLGRHQVVDDTPYGGGSGMVMRCDVVASAVRAVRAQAEAEGRAASPVVLFEPSGHRFDQRMAERFAALPGLTLVCGHYEGIDARFAEGMAEECPIEVVSIGDFVLTGGEYAAAVVIDAVARLLPGVLGNASSATVESFAPGGGLEFPQYTRPRVWEGREVPEVLVSGHHGRVEAWRRAESAARTARVRPDLLPPR